jgi:hypothetical protein
MTSKKVFFAMLGAVVIVTGLTTASVVLGSSMLKKKSAELVELKLQDRLIEEQERALVQAKKDIEKYHELDEAAKAIVPQDKDQAKTVREIISLADQSGVKISSISFPESSLGTKVPLISPTTNTDGATSAPAVQAPPITQVKPVDGIKGVYEMSVAITVTNEITYLQLIDFLTRLEQNRRTAQITNISISPNQLNRNFLNFNIEMNVFVKP